MGRGTEEVKKFWNEDHEVQIMNGFCILHPWKRLFATVMVFPGFSVPKDSEGCQATATYLLHPFASFC